MNTVLLAAIIAFVVGVIFYIWDDLTEELRYRVEEDAKPTRSFGTAPQILSLVGVSDDGLVTPRGVEIPPEWLDDDGISLEDALDWLEYVEALG